MTLRRLALFANGPVGERIATVLGAAGAHVACLVVDESDESARDRMLTALGADAEPVVLTHSSADSPAGIRRLSDLQLDLGILAWWPHILRRPVINTAQMGFLNLHPGLLPFNRGKDPNFWSIVDETPFGVTLHFVDEGVDTGPIVSQRSLEVGWEDTGGSLYWRAREAAIELFRDNVDAILNGELPRQAQDDARATSHTRAELDVRSRLSLADRLSVREVLNLLRARTFPGFPAARFTEGGQTYEVRVQITPVDEQP